VYLGGCLVYLSIFHHIFFISFFTVFICRSSCITVLLIYHGTSIVVKVLDWNRCIISMLEFEAVPQSCIPHVRIGLITTLYKSNLLSVDSVDCLPSSQYIFLNPTLSCFLFILICFAQVSLRSRCILVHLKKPTSYKRVSCVLYLVDNTVAHGLCRRVQVTYIMSTYWLFVQALLPHACRNNDMRLLSTAQRGYLNWQHRLQGDVVSSCFVSCTLAGEGGVQKVFPHTDSPPHTHTRARERDIWAKSHYGLDDRSGSQPEAGILLFASCVLTGSGAHPVLSTRAFLLRGKTAEAWSWPLISLRLRGEWRGPQ
jgi:hypothetical protein